MNTSNKGSIYTDLVAMYDSANNSERERIINIMNLRYNQGLYVVMNWANEGGDPEYAYRGYDLDEAKKELASAGRVSGFEHINQSWFLSEDSADDSTAIDSRDIPAINSTTDDILSIVTNYFGGKYSNHETEDGNWIKLRIADHSGKHANNQGEGCISIVIANVNKTERFYTQGPEGIRNEHYFNEDHTADEIIDAINELLTYEGCVISA